MIPQAAERARWSVMWQGKRGITEKKFGDDFAGALKAYTTLKAADKKWVTLRCTNVGFAPPARTAPKMDRYNRQGVWWCPYCIQLRRFTRDKSWLNRIVMHCPVCKVTNNDYHVKRWNPQAKLLEMRRSRVRRTRRRRT